MICTWRTEIPCWQLPVSSRHVIALFWCAGKHQRRPHQEVRPSTLMEDELSMRTHARIHCMHSIRTLDEQTHASVDAHMYINFFQGWHAAPTNVPTYDTWALISRLGTAFAAAIRNLSKRREVKQHPFRKYQLILDFNDAGNICHII